MLHGYAPGLQKAGRQHSGRHVSLSGSFASIVPSRNHLRSKKGAHLPIARATTKALQRTRDEPAARDRGRRRGTACRYVGYPWSGRYVAASGNLLADFRFNLTAESQGRLQACRLYELTDDSGVRDMLSFLIARDAMHQNQWLAAIEELQADGLEATPVPITFPRELELQGVSYQFLNLSEGTESQAGRWAKGPSIDGKGQFEYVANPKPLSSAPELGQVDPRVHGTLNEPKPPKAST